MLDEHKNFEVESLWVVDDDVEVGKLMESLHVILAFDHHLVQHKGSQQEIYKPDLVFTSCHLFLGTDIVQLLQKQFEDLLKLSLCLPKKRLGELCLFWVEEVQSIVLGQARWQLQLVLMLFFQIIELFTC